MIFILGKGRSGTSLLQNMLDAHPAVIGPPESKFIILFYPRFAHIKKWTEKDILRFVESVYMELLFANVWNIDRNKLTETLLSLKESATYDLLCKAVYYQMRRGKEHAIYISDKNPNYILFIDILLKIFPDARFVHIVREPRDNIYSHLTTFDEKNIPFMAYKWVGFNKIIEESKKKHPGRYFSLTYENLVSDTENIMRKLSTFLEIPFAEETTRNKVPEQLANPTLKSEFAERALKIHKELLRPVNTSNIGKWRQGMSKFDRTATEIITAGYAREKYGYEMEINPADKVKIALWRLLWGKYLYYTWQAFTRWRFKHFQFNLVYSRIKKRIKKDKLPFWEQF